MPTRVRPRPEPGQPIPVPDPPPSPPPITPVPAPPTVLGAPRGKIPTDLKIAYGRGGDWATVNQHDVHFIKYGTQYRVPPAMLKAMCVVESGGQSIPNGNGFPNFGCMQLTHSWNGGRKTTWEAIGEKLGVDFKSCEGQIAIAAYRLGGHYGDPGTPEEIFLAHYYPTPCLDCPGQDGHTPRQYLDDLQRLVGIINAAVPPAPPAPLPEPPAPRPITEQDVLNLISNNTPGVRISFGFNQPNIDNGQPVEIYHYGKGHGTAGNHMHPGIDIWVPDETPINAVLGGTVVCVGKAGPGAWGQSCGYFSDDDGGIGKIELITDRTITLAGKSYPLKVTYGHMSSSVVRVGQHVADGERIGRSGVARGWPHIHLDVEIEAPHLNNPQIWNNPGSYHLIDPVPNIIKALGGQPVQPIPVPDPNITRYVAHQLPGSAVPLYLPHWLPFRVRLTPPGSNRRQVPMRPTVTVYHSTNNNDAGTGAWHHAGWQERRAPGHPNCVASPATCPIGVHGYVDAKEVVWTIPVNEKGVHSGDWRNDWGIAVERTTNSDQNQAEAENNAMHAHAGLLYAIKKTAIDAMYPHTDGGHCPRLIKPWREVERIVDMRVGRIEQWVADNLD